MSSYDFTELEILSFDKIAFAHSLTVSDYSYVLSNHGYGIYGDTPENGGVLEVGFVEQNPLIFTNEDGEFTAEEKSIFIIPPETDFSIRSKHPGIHRHTSAEFLITCNVVKISKDSASHSGKKAILPYIIPPSKENESVFSTIRAIANSKMALIKHSYFEECADFMRLIHQLTELALTSGAGGSLALIGGDNVSPGNRRHCNRAKAYISENISQRLRISEIAAAVGVSKNYLTNVFSESEGMTIVEYINRLKLSYMTELMRRYSYTLAEAGEHVGFTDVNYISRIFKKYYGMTVTEYKRTWRR